MDGLIIKPYWLDLILKGKKTLEIRGSSTSKIGEKIYLIESRGKVKGTAVIDKTIPLNKKLWEQLQSFHKVESSFEELLERYKKPYAWSLTNVAILKAPFDYEKHHGAVIWIKDVKKI